MEWYLWQAQSRRSRLHTLVDLHNQVRSKVHSSFTLNLMKVITNTLQEATEVLITVEITKLSCADTS